MCGPVELPLERLYEHHGVPYLPYQLVMLHLSLRRRVYCTVSGQMQRFSSCTLPYCTSYEQVCCYHLRKSDKELDPEPNTLGTHTGSPEAQLVKKRSWRRVGSGPYFPPPDLPMPPCMAPVLLPAL
jgi:hypothetical protein